MHVSTDSLDRIAVVTPEQRTRLEERADRLHPAMAGAFAGGAAGIAMIAIADRMLHARPDGYDLVQFAGRLVTDGRLEGVEAQGAGFGVAFGAGLVVGVVFALVTRHLRKFAPLLIWSLVVFPAVWTVLQAFVLPKTAPWLAAALPFVPMVVGSLAFAFVVALQLPLRKRRAPRPALEGFEDDL